MSGLSIFEAAKSAPDRAFLMMEGRSFSFSEVAELARVAANVSADAPIGWSARPNPEAIGQLFGLIEAGPCVFVHDERDPTSWVDLGTNKVGSIAVSTSGSSGRPKWIPLPLGALVASAESVIDALGVTTEDRWLLSLPLFHLGGLAVLLRSCLARSTVVLTKPPFDPEARLRTIHQEGVTLASLVPAQLHRILDAAYGSPPPPALRTVLLGGAAASTELVERARAAGWPIRTTYGLTEAAGTVSISSLDSHPKSSGRVLPHLAVRIQEGRIAIRIPSLSDRSAERGPAWIETQDLGVWLFGRELGVLGRADDLIISGGEKVSPLLVERCLLSVAGIAEASVFGIEDAVYGTTVAAAIVPAKAKTFDPAKLQNALLSLPPSARPRRVALVSDLVHLPSGKVDRAATKDRTRGLLSSWPAGLGHDGISG